jgi:hypothetical protein
VEKSYIREYSKNILYFPSLVSFLESFLEKNFKVRKGVGAGVLCSMKTREYYL